MDYRTVVVPMDDIGLLQAAIALGGGTITHSRRCGEADLAVTYVAPRPGSATLADAGAPQCGG